jgi:hypothetical protein
MMQKDFHFMKDVARDVTPKQDNGSSTLTYSKIGKQNRGLLPESRAYVRFPSHLVRRAA